MTTRRATSVSSCCRAAMTVILTAVLAVSFAACKAPRVPQLSNAHSVAETCPGNDDSNYFFPSDSIAEPAAANNWLIPHYSELLRLIDASPLWCGKQISEAYRLIVLPPFEAPLVMELARADDGWQIVSATFSGPAKLEQREQSPTLTVKGISRRPLEEDSAAAFLRELEGIAFWSTPSFKRSGTSDATALTIEARRDGSYRAVTRLSGDSDPLEVPARILIETGGVELPTALGLGTRRHK
jgi:hypothetical protein